MDTIGKRLKFALKQKGIKQKEFSKLTGISLGTLSQVIRDLRSPKAETLFVIARPLNINLHWLITGEGDPNAKLASHLGENHTQHITMSGKNERLNVAFHGKVLVKEPGGKYGKDVKKDDLEIFNLFLNLDEDRKQTIREMIELYSKSDSKSKSK